MERSSQKLVAQNGKECYYVDVPGGLKCSYSASRDPRTETSCRDLYSGYKNVCNKIWDKQCRAGNKDNREIKELAEKCLNGRIDFSKKCCNSQFDLGHCGAINKMNNILFMCDYVEKPKETIAYIPLMETDRKNLMTLLGTDSVKGLIKQGWKFKSVVYAASAYEENPDYKYIEIPDTNLMLVLKK